MKTIYDDNGKIKGYIVDPMQEAEGCSPKPAPSGSAGPSRPNEPTDLGTYVVFVLISLVVFLIQSSIVEGIVVGRTLGWILIISNIGISLVISWLLYKLRLKIYHIRLKKYEDSIRGKGLFND